MENIKSFIKNIDKYKLLIFICIASGIFLRILFFSYNRPFWLDECSLVLNIIERNNYFIPLKYEQAAPQLFMYVSKLLYIIPFSGKEYLLRIIPLVSSVLSIGVFYLLADKFFVKKITKFTAVLIFSTCYPLCIYAQQFKQYSSDLFCFLLILFSYFYLKNILDNKKKLLILGLTYSILMWMSFTSVFAIFSVLIVLFIFNRKICNKIYCTLVPVAVNFILYYLANKSLNSDEYLHQYWQNYFISANFSNFYSIFIHNISFVFSNKIIAGSIFIISTIFTAIKNKQNEVFYLLIIPFIIECILSYCHIYPFSRRLILFLVPIFILLTVKILDFINIKNKYANYILYAAIITSLSIPVINNSYKNIILKNYYRENLPILLEKINFLAKPNDVIYIPYSSYKQYKYYNYLLKKNIPVILEEKVNSIDEYIDNLHNLKENTTYYWVNSQFSPERDNLVVQWAKKQKNYSIYQDKYLNTLIIFTK